MLCPTLNRRFGPGAEVIWNAMACRSGQKRELGNYTGAYAKCA